MHLHRIKLDGSPSYEEIVEKWKSHVPTDSPVFSEHFLISFVSNSSQLEGINVDYNSTREIFEKEKVSNYTGDLRDIFSVVNNKKVAAIMNQALVNKEPVTPDLIKRVHKAVMFASVDSHRYHDNGERAGEFKHADYCVGRYSVGAPPEEVARFLGELCGVVAEGAKDPAKLATVFHCNFEMIHPFADGNGRVGRWMTNYILVQHGHPPILFEDSSRKQYYMALETADAVEDYEPMYKYIREQTVASWPAVKYLAR